MLTFVVICMLLGAVGGLLAGLLGIGGGLVIVPALVYLLPLYQIVPPEQIMVVAVATSLGSVIFTSLSSMRAHHRLANVPWHIAPAVLFGAAIGALLVGSTAHLLSGEYLKRLFAVAVMWLAYRMLFKPALSVQTILPAKPLLMAISVGLAAIAGALGIGGGALFVPMLHHFSVDLRKAIGLAAVTGTVIACFATLGYIQSGWMITADQTGFVGYVYLPAVAALVTTSIFAAPIGAKLTQRLPLMHIKRVFGVFLVLVSARMLLS